MTFMNSRGLATLCLLPALCLGTTDHAVGQEFVNASFEAWGSATLCGVNTPPDSWASFNGPGAPGVDEGNFALCFHTIPAGAHDGTTYVRSYATVGGGEGIAQVVSGLVPGRTYQVRFYYSGSNVYGGTADGAWRTYIDGVNIDETPYYSSLQTTWSERTMTFTATSTQHEVGFRGWRTQSGTGSASLGLDDVSIHEVASTSTYGNPCSVGSQLALSSNDPVIGSTWTLQGSGIEPVSSLAVFWFGSAALTPAFDLSSAGAVGCFVHTNADLGAYSSPAGGGASSYAIPVPNTPALSGTQLFVQMSAASAATAIGFTTSNGLAAVVGV